MRGLLNPPALVMLMVQVIIASVSVLYKVAVNDGTSISVLTAYRLIFAAAITIPLAFIFERQNRPKLTCKVVFMASLLLNLYFESLALTSATYASAIFNLSPAVTFILAVSFRLERLNFDTAAGMAKVLGTITAAGGAMLLTFLKGVEVKIWTFHINLLHKEKSGTLNGDGGSKLLGIFLGIGSCISYAMWLIIQAKMNREYQGHYSSTALMCLAGAIQATVYALCVEKDLSQWRLCWNIKLLTAAYTGIVGTGINFILITWCVVMRGPLFASVFNPLLLVIVAIVGSLMLDEKLYLGSVIGASLIMIGLYVILWGKNKEMKSDLEITSEIEAVVTSTQ
ncbi:hypothetical protein P8452_06213 [Trifolium repens]|nr:hypothetical protein P8452_06213 [Trifolium repens]